MKQLLRVLAWPHGDPNELNPYVRLRYTAFTPPDAQIIPFTAGMLNIPAADVFHVHWPEGVFEGRGANIAPLVWLKMQNVLRTARRIRSGGGIVVLTAHNLAPHEKFSFWKRRLWNRYHAAFLRQVDLVVGMTRNGLAAFRDVNAVPDNTPGIVIAHSNYHGAYPAPPARDDARRRFGLDPSSRVVGAIGSIRPSKNIPDAIRMFRQVAQSGETLFVAGGCEDEVLWGEVEAEAGDDARIILRRGMLSDEDLSAAFVATDVCLISQSPMLNSGTALLALSYDRPVIAPADGAMPELQESMGDKWLRLYPAPLDADGLRAALGAASPASGAHCAPIDKLEPAHVSRLLLESFRRQLERRRS